MDLKKIHIEIWKYFFGPLKYTNNFKISLLESFIAKKYTEYRKYMFSENTAEFSGFFRFVFLRKKSSNVLVFQKKPLYK